MPRPGPLNARWVIVAIPATVVVLPLLLALVILAVKPAKELEQSAREVAPPPAPKLAPVAEAPPAEPANVPPPAPVAAEPTPAPPTPAPVAPAPPPPAVASNTPPTLLPTEPPKPAPVAPPTPTPAPAPSPAPSPAAQPPVDLLASLDVAANAVSGEWAKDGSNIRCANATSKARAKLRLVPPPTGGGYDFAMTFTPEGDRRFVAHVLSFKGKQFIFAMFSNQSGFASVKGQNALQNETTKNKGVKAGTKHTSVVKVRDKEVSAYLDGELLSTYTTDYSDLELSDAWNLGGSGARESLLGLAVECPVTIESITLTPLEPQSIAPPPAPVAAGPSYKDLAAMISSPYSMDSSAAATQPAAMKAMSAGDLKAIAAAAQPAISDVAAALLKPAAPSPQADALFNAAQASLAEAHPLPDPLLEQRPDDATPDTLDRAQFDAEQARLSAWRTLVGRMKDLYPSAQPKNDAVKLQFTRPSSFFATNASGEPLTNVTLAVEMAHAMTAPSPTDVQYYFVPRWAPNQKVFLPAAIVPNVASPQLLADAGPTPSPGPGGLVEAKVQLWSDKVAQPSQAVRFEKDAAALGRAYADYAFRMIEDATRRTGPATRSALQSVRITRPNAAIVGGPIVAPRADLTDASPELSRAKAVATLAAAMLPPNGTVAGDAKNAMAQPLTALREMRKRQLDAFVDALDAKSTRNGGFVIHKPGVAAKMIKAADREATINAAGAGGGKMVMTIDSRSADGTSVAVTLTAPDQPELKRKFNGRLHVDSSNALRLLLILRSTQPPLGKAPAEGELRKVNHWTSLTLELRGTQLLGIATAGPTDSSTTLNVAFGPPTAAKEPAPPAGSPPKPKPRTAK